MDDFEKLCASTNVTLLLSKEGESSLINESQ